MFVSLYQNANTHAFDINMQVIEWPFSSLWTKQKQGFLIGPFYKPTKQLEKEVTDTILYSHKVMSK